MEKQLNRLLLVTGLLLPILAHGQGRDGKLYRYTNDEGVVVMGYQMPNEYIHRGYEVLNSKGRVVKVVPPQASAEEQRAQEEALAEEKRLKEWDESLLLRYSTVVDIEAARERSLGDLRIRLEILKSNKRSYRQQVEIYQAQAANQERGGSKTDVELLTAIEDLQTEIASTERAISEREVEIEAVSVAYQKDMERFEELEAVVERRRALSGQ